MKVCHLASGTPGGISKMTLNLLEVQRQTQGLEVAVLLLSPGSWEKQYALSDVSVLDYTQGKLGWSKCRSIAQKLREFDLIHMHFFVPILAFFLWWYNIRVVYTCHSVRGGNRQPHRFDRFRQWLFRCFLNKFVRGVVFVSEFTRAYWQSHGITQAKARVIPNGTIYTEDTTTQIDLPFFPDDYVIGVCASFGKVKRLDLLFQAFALLAKENHAVRLMLVGDGPERAALENLAKDLGITKKVWFAGFQDHPLPYQKRMNLCVLPSVGETFGLAALEMLHLGKPVIACSDGGGVCEVLSPWADDIVAPTPEALASRMEYHFYHQENIDSKYRVMQSLNYSIQTCAQEYYMFYKFYMKSGI